MIRPSGGGQITGGRLRADSEAWDGARGVRSDGASNSLPGDCTVWQSVSPPPGVLVECPWFFVLLKAASLEREGPCKTLPDPPTLCVKRALAH